jgi:hypothetical protein
VGIDWPSWPLALAAFGQNRRLDPDATDMLRSAAKLGIWKSEQYTALLKALLHQETYDGKTHNLDARVSSIRKARLTADRTLNSHLLGQALSEMPRDKYLEAVEQLNVGRAHEVEPEIRISLGEAIVEAKVARYGEAPIGESSD